MGSKLEGAFANAAAWRTPLPATYAVAWVLLYGGHSMGAIYAAAMAFTTHCLTAGSASQITHRYVHLTKSNPSP